VFPVVVVVVVAPDVVVLPPPLGLLLQVHPLEEQENPGQALLSLKADMVFQLPSNLALLLAHVDPVAVPKTADPP